MEKSTWEIAQGHEQSWWGNCRNTFGEEIKQAVYAKKMGLEIFDDGNSTFVIKSPADKIIDIGCGPVSMLLKLNKMGEGTIRVAIDPCDYPGWTKLRYADAGILFERYKGEDIPYDLGYKLDEAWIYNVLQHTENPAKVIESAKRIANKVRIFEWIDHETNAMHPHRLTEEKLNEWLGAKGNVEVLEDKKTGLYGKCYNAIVEVPVEAKV